MKKYRIEVVRWEPQTVLYEIEAPTSLEARHEALRRVRDREIESSEYGGCEVDDTIPVRTTLLSCARIRE